MSAISKAYMDSYNAIQDTVEKAIRDDGQKVLLSYSVYEDENDVPVNNLKEVPIKGKVIFLSEEEDFRSEVYESPTWLEIAVIANRMCLETESDFRVFLDELSVYETYVEKVEEGNAHKQKGLNKELICEVKIIMEDI